MYVNIAADTYEKVDAAVALVELLITSVSVCPEFLNLDTSLIFLCCYPNVIRPCIR